MKHRKLWQFVIYFFSLAFLFVGFFFITLLHFKSRARQEAPVKSMNSWQQADAPLGFALGGFKDKKKRIPRMDLRFVQLSAFERVSLPVVSRVSMPMGSEHGALTYNAQRYWEFSDRYQGHHTGDDLNGIGGMNTDLGDPVYAVAAGIVAFRGEPARGWGNTLLLAHRLPEGKYIYSMYSHLDEIFVPYGSMIYRGQKIGTVGTASGAYPAHLHLEMHSGPYIGLSSGYEAKPLAHLDPTEIISTYQSPQAEKIYPSPLAILLKEKMQRQMREMRIEFKNLRKGTYEKSP